MIKREFEVTQPSESDLESFHQICHQLYYNRSTTAGAQIHKFIQSQPPSLQPIFSKLQAKIRSQFHADSLASRRSKLSHLLLNTQPSFPPKSREGRAKRYAGLVRWLHRNCTPSLPGTHPFARGLWLLLKLQSTSGKGGPGDKRVEWEVDEVALLEAGGGDWTEDTISLLMGILGCSQRFVDLSSRPSSAYTSETHSRVSHDMSQGSSVSSHATVRQNLSYIVPTITTTTATNNLSDYPPDQQQQYQSRKKQPPPPPPPSRRTLSNPTPPRQRPTPPPLNSIPSANSLRSRSDSDPFGDPKELLENERPRRPGLLEDEIQEDTEVQGNERGQVEEGKEEEGVTLEFQADDSTSAPNTALPLLGSTGFPTTLPSPTPRPRRPPRSISSLEAHMVPRYYVFTLPPYLTNPELRMLCSLFPSSLITKQCSEAKFNTTGGEKDKDEEAHVAADMKEVRVPGAHGTIRVAKGKREEGWKGGVWERWKTWWKKMFGKKY